MGLCIKAYSRAQLVSPWPQDGDYDDSVHVESSPSLLRDFPERADGLQSGLYTAQEAAFTLSIGYGGWSQWRALAAAVMLGKSVGLSDGWALKSAEEGPLGHLLCFTDSEGILGPATCARLAREAAEVRERFQSACPSSSEVSYSRLNALGIYDRVAALLAHAADDGFVLFC